MRCCLCSCPQGLSRVIQPFRLRLQSCLSDTAISILVYSVALVFILGLPFAKLFKWKGYWFGWGYK